MTKSSRQSLVSAWKKFSGGPRLTGILNGVDYKTWNPETDALVAANFSSENFSGKAICKADLQGYSHLPVRPDVPVIGMVSRLSNQKGIDILGGAMQSLMEHDLQLVLLGYRRDEVPSVLRGFSPNVIPTKRVFSLQL